MQKWEYRLLKALSTDLGFTLINVDNENVSKPRGFKVEGPDFFEYLGKMGQDGWEVVNMTSEGATHQFLLKRPLV